LGTMSGKRPGREKLVKKKPWGDYVGAEKVGVEVARKQYK